MLWMVDETVSLFNDLIFKSKDKIKFNYSFYWLKWFIIFIVNSSILCLIHINPTLILCF